MIPVAALALACALTVDGGDPGHAAVSLGDLGSRGGGGMPVTPRPAGRPVKVNETDISATGIDAELAHRTLARGRAGQKACYQRGLLDDPTLAGTLTVAFELDAAGNVTKAVPTGGSLKGTEVAGCAVRRVFATAFPVGAPGRSVTATLNFALEGADAPLGTSAPPLPERLELEVDEERVFRLPGVQRIAVSNTSSYDIRALGDDLVWILGVVEGATTLLFWTTNGKRVSTLLKVVPRHTPPPGVPIKPSSRPSARLEADGGVSRGEVEVFEIPEELHDIREVAGGDGGRVFEGFNAAGAKRTITLRPRK